DMISPAESIASASYPSYVMRTSAISPDMISPAESIASASYPSYVMSGALSVPETMSPNDSAMSIGYRKNGISRIASPIDSSASSTSRGYGRDVRTSSCRTWTSPENTKVAANETKP